MIWSSAGITPMIVMIVVVIMMVVMPLAPARGRRRQPATVVQVVDHVSLLIQLT